MKTTNILLSGFGGQGILFAGKQLAKIGMDVGLNVSWLPSYGPEMRGGAANCSVIVSEKEIGSPIVTNPDVLIALNLPSFEKFEPAIRKGGILIADSMMINVKSKRNDITAYYIPATKIAAENHIEGMANVIILGYLLKITKIFDYELFLDKMIKNIPPKKAALIDKNRTALSLGYNYCE